MPQQQLRHGGDLMPEPLATDPGAPRDLEVCQTLGSDAEVAKDGVELAYSAVVPGRLHRVVPLRGGVRAARLERAGGQVSSRWR